MQQKVWVAGPIVAAMVGAGAAAGATDRAPQHRGAEAGVWASVVVSATRVPEASEALPVSIDRLDREAIGRDRLQVNLSESLAAVPGVVAQSRQNYAQDLQMSVRGFGARSSFGVRGVRLYADGVPATMPDGQGQFSHFDLGSAARIEVLRGPFSALYGNSSGGVVSVFTGDGLPGLDVGASASVGTFDTERYALTASGQQGPVNFSASASHFRTDGYRAHSAAERNIANLKFGLELPGSGKLTVIGNAVETPYIDDPLGLTRLQLEQDPAQAGTNAILYNTRKSLRQEQLGLRYEQPLGDGTDFATLAYAGQRHTRQFQSTLRTAQAPPTHPGGVIDLGRDYAGVDLHVSHSAELGGRPLRLTVGAAYDRLHESRRGYLNFIGPDVGVQGALRRDEANRVDSLDEYAELAWDPGARWRLTVGARHAAVTVTSRNRLPTASGLAESGTHYSATNPVAGVVFRATPQLNAYASYGKGFETPTLNDLAYRSTDGNLPGLNLGLRPMRSDNFEAGIKLNRDAWRSTLAAFHVRARDELAVRVSAAGRSVFQNIAATERSGLELTLDARMRPGFTGRLAYTYLRAVVTEDYSTCAGLPCVPVQVVAGRRLPAVPANTLFAGLTWAPSARLPAVSLESLYRTRIFVDDRNSDFASGYWSANLGLSLEQQRASWHVAESVRLDNLFDRRYVGSVIVNDGNGRFFEPAPGRTAYAAFRVNFR